MQLSIGFSPCPNDTFMLEALMHRRIDIGEMEFIPYIEDIETLNTWALEGRLDITKLSFSTWLKVRAEYVLLDAGAALGRGCGPLVIAKEQISEEQILNNPVAIPGELTTANMLFSLRYPLATHKIPMLFSEIESSVLRGDVIAGLIIHENRFTYAAKGLVKIMDLGEYWEQETGYPIPLGAFAVHKRHQSLQSALSASLRRSVEYAWNDPTKVMPYVRSYAQEMGDSVMQAHIKTYVNEYSLDLGQKGFEAIEILQKRAKKARLI